MAKIYFYKDKQGRQPVKEWIQELALNKDKNSRIQLNKIRDYVKALEEHGTQIGKPYVKHIVDDIWELRPIRNRIFFVVLIGDNYVLLHQFVKKTQKTPRREIEQAKKEALEVKNEKGSY